MAKVTRMSEQTALSGDQYVVRPLRPEDAEQLGPLHVGIWQQTYVGLMSDEHLASLDQAASVEWWRSVLTDEDAPTSLGAFTPDGELAGWITVGPARDDDAPCERELWVLNLDQAHHGSGLATRLVTQTLGDERAYLWVVEGNARAIRFYEKHGFVLDGARQDDERNGNVDLRMTRPA